MNFSEISFCMMIVIAVAACIGCAHVKDENELLTVAGEINKRLLVLDSHVDIPLDYATDKVDPGILNENLKVDLPKMEAGGVDCVFLIAYIPQKNRTPKGYESARHRAGTMIGSIHRLCEQDVSSKSETRLFSR